MRCGLALFVCFFVAIAVMVPGVQADRGVGVTLGRIDIDGRLSPGGRYSLPALGVINTGDEPGQYEVAVSYEADQPQRRPAESWFSFEPQRFLLYPREIQNVQIRLTVPTGASAGDYFAFIEAQPITSEEGVAVGVAAATKLSFNVKPASWLQAQRVWLNRVIDDAEPWSYLIPGMLLTGMMLFSFARFFRVRFRVERRRGKTAALPAEELDPNELSRRADDGEQP
jgi:hypothetical protein